MATSKSEALLKRPLYVYDLPGEILETLHLRLDNEFPAIPDATPTTLSDATSPDASPNGKAISCALCSQTFPTVLDQRGHVRSDLHKYNLKQRLKGAKPVSENDFEQMIANLDDSLSGSDTDSSDSEEDETKREGNLLSALLKKQANIDETDDGGFVTRTRKAGPGKAPLLWFKASALPSDTSLGVYRSLFTASEQEGDDPAHVLRAKQLSPSAPPKRADDEGGVPLPFANVGPHIFMCMIGGGHFAGMIVSLAPKVSKKGGVEERQATVLAHKTFHRYTTRRKQGGAQSSNDNSKGNAHSAGASIRRYNEDALMKDVREILHSWRNLISSSDLLFIRATNNTNRRTLFGEYDGQVLRGDDPRMRGFPFNTRRPTQAELMRCFVELTRVKVSRIDEAAEEEARQRLAAAAAAAEEEAKATAASASKQSRPKPQKDADAELALLHTSQLEAFVKRSKFPALQSYLTSNSLSPDFRFHPTDSQQHHHTPTPLHMASSLNNPTLVTSLLVRAGADPAVLNGEGRTAFEVAGDRATRDAFRVSRSEIGEAKWDWAGARVPEPLTKADVERRAEKEKSEEAAREEARREAGMQQLKADEARKAAEQEANGAERRGAKYGVGMMVGERQTTAEERREAEASGMTPQVRAELERERRARAAERRMAAQNRG